MTYIEFCNLIKSLNPNTSIGVHGINTNTLSKGSVGKEIIKTGLNLTNWGGILSSIKMYGRVKDLSEQDLLNIYNYAYGVGNNEEVENILFGFPEVITNSDNKDFYLGYYNRYDLGYAKGQKEAGADLPLNQLFDKMHIIPNSFIIGLFNSQNNNQSINFSLNNYFYEFQNNPIFFDSLFNALKDNKIINIIDYYKYKDMLKEWGLDNTLIMKQYEEYLSQIEEKIPKKN